MLIFKIESFTCDFKFSKAHMAKFYRCCDCGNRPKAQDRRSVKKSNEWKPVFKQLNLPDQNTHLFCNKCHIKWRKWIKSEPVNPPSPLVQDESNDDTHLNDGVKVEVPILLCQKCCAHVTCSLWFLGFARHHGYKLNENSARGLEDASENVNVDDDPE